MTASRSHHNSHPEILTVDHAISVTDNVPHQRLNMLKIGAIARQCPPAAGWKVNLRRIELYRGGDLIRNKFVVKLHSCPFSNHHQY